MMILNLINVIAIAMGIGTSAKNTSFNYEKKTHKNIVLEINETLEYSQSGNLVTYGSTNPGSSYDTMGKYMINNNPNWHDDNIMIQTTSYTRLRNNYRQNGTDIYQFTSSFSYVEIYNYYDSDLTFTLSQGAYVGSTTTFKYTGQIISTRKDLSPTINLTLTQNTYNELMTYTTSIIQDETSEQIYNNTITEDSTSHNPSFGTTLTTPEITLNGHEKIGLYISGSITNMPEVQSAKSYENIALRASSLKIEGTVNNIDQPRYIEVVNIPELMFTILAMPFSFISQAFNLTIFPDTPYSINFSNLFITIIAIFILLWLIKHIFK